MDIRIRKHADVLMKYSLNIREGEQLLIRGDMVTFPLIRECYKVALEMGAMPQVRITNDEVREILLKHGSDEQIQYIPDDSKLMIETVDVMLMIIGGSNTRILTNVDPKKMKLAAQGASEINRIFFERMGKKELRWCATMYPAEAYAQEANMSLTDYEDFMYNACFIEDEECDPVAKWVEIEKNQEIICKALNKKKHLRIVSEDTDLTMSIENRIWINCSGKVNFPDGEVFTSPVEDSVEGIIRFSFPGIYGGREIEDIRLVFSKGKVVEASAAKGEDLLNQLLDTDEGARYVGEIAVGTNSNIRKFTRNMLFDEKIGGTVHLAVGRSIPESLGKNESAIHWDMLCDMRSGGKIYADGQVIYENGKFLL
ncbi:aminopeptidase [Candidatus Latescibacterota bacterium]